MDNICDPASQALPMFLSNNPGKPTNLEQQYLYVAQTWGFNPKLRWPWALCGGCDRIQGWKLHVSAIPENAAALLNRVLPLLKLHQVSFKFISSPMLLASLNEGEIGATQIGKFMAIYPVSDDQVAQLAEELAAATCDFIGPTVKTDLALGGQVFARYGGINPIIIRDRLGGYNKYIRDPDGVLIPDDYVLPHDYPSWIPDPFEQPDTISWSHDEQTLSRNKNEESGSKLFGPGYLILQTLKAHGKGGVFLAMDLRSQDRVALKVIKQGRKHCLTDDQGRDMRHRLKRQLSLSEATKGLDFFPHAESYFEVKGDGFLVLEHLEGQSLENLIFSLHDNQPWGDINKSEQKRLLLLFRTVVEKVALVHNLGYVHRDLTASNIWVSNNDRIYLLDLELMHATADPTAAFGLGTTGFMSPQQSARQPPTIEDDLYALGSVLLLILTGIDPRRVLCNKPENPLPENWATLAYGAPYSLIDLVEKCLKSAKDQRPRPNDILAAINIAIENKNEEAIYQPPILDLDHCIQHGLTGLVQGTARDSKSGLWFSPAFQTEQAAAGNATLIGDFEIRRSANRGISGPLYLIARLKKSGFDTGMVLETTMAAITWLLSSETAPDSEMPGLHFGDAGVALTLTEACTAGLIKKSTVLARIEELLTRPIDWPDITHGAAGQGLAALQCANLLNQPGLIKIASECTAYLLDCQTSTGAWIMPDGMPGMSGETLPGFAHGVAGIAYYLLRYASATGNQPAMRAGLGALEWLKKEKRPHNDGKIYNWRYSDKNEEEWRWWCHGGPGISLAFLEGYRLTGNTEYSTIVHRALAIHPNRLQYHNLSTCHGLAGIGEIYIEAHRVLHDDMFIARARSIASTLSGLAHEGNDGALVWTVEDPLTPFSDLMVGTSGVLHFLLRLQRPDLNYGFPLLG